MKRIPLYCLGGLLCLSLAACTSSTRGKVNQVKNDQPIISPTLQEENLALKRVVAISRFTDETKRTNSFLIDDKGNRLGKQAADILSARLTDTNKFIMLERDAFGEVMQEGERDEGFDQVGADFLIVGSVSEFGRSTTSDVGVFSRNKIQTASATVNVRLINTRNGQIVYSEEATGEARTEANRVLGVGETAGYDTSLDDKAISAAISKLVSNIMENLLDSPWQAYLVGSEDGMLMMTGGENQGIEIGQEFKVINRGKRVKNPQTGMTIELPGKEAATIRVVSFIGNDENALSFSTIEEGSVDVDNLSSYVVREK